MIRRGVLARFGKYLPLTKATPQLNLGEGDTPLISAPRLARELGCAELWFKFEGANPTGSFKDRGMVVAVAKAIERGAETVICASTGNTSASAAAYAAAAGIQCRVVVPEGKVALGKLAQALAHGAKLIIVGANFDRALRAVQALAKGRFVLVNSINPHRLEGQKTAAFEICEALGRVPDGLALPVGNAGNIAAYWKGFSEWVAIEPASQGKRPVLYGFQASGAAPIVRGKVIEHPETIATAIRIGNPASWKLAETARDESRGLIAEVTDAEILTAYRRVAAEAGIFCEPASAAPLAGLLKLSVEKPERFRGQTLVAVLTGHGLKDPDSAILNAPPLPAPLPDDIDALQAALG